MLGRSGSFGIFSILPPKKGTSPGCIGVIGAHIDRVADLGYVAARQLDTGLQNETATMQSPAPGGGSCRSARRAGLGCCAGCGGAIICPGFGRGLARDIGQMFEYRDLLLSA